jgi:hypothetical protein
LKSQTKNSEKKKKLPMFDGSKRRHAGEAKSRPGKAREEQKQLMEPRHSPMPKVPTEPKGRQVAITLQLQGAKQQKDNRSRALAAGTFTAVNVGKEKVCGKKYYNKR